MVKTPATLVLLAAAAITGCSSVPERQQLSQPVATPADIRALAYDIRQLRHDLCVIAARTELVEVRQDPVNGRNHVMARDGAIRSTRACEK